MNKAYKTRKVKKHYEEQANEFGASKLMSMKDINVKDMEIIEIIKYLRILKTNYYNPKILEVGCGNGYTAEKINEELNLKLTGLDFCEDLVKIAKGRKLEYTNFQVGTVLDLSFNNSAFHIAFTERCLINLKSWEKQKKALNEIWRVLKKGGVFIIIEAFTDGLKDLNQARKAVGLEQIKQPFHNRYINKQLFLDFIKGKFQHYSINHPEFAEEYNRNFLSSYYFGSRVVYPALIKNGKMEYNNKFIEFFKFIAPYGNYSYIQSFVLEKI